MQAEREELLKRVFPRLRRWCAQRALTLSDVDLRWGITEEQSERGESLPLCLAEIDRCRPFFLCLLGERYGWVPGRREFQPELLDQYPWIRNHPDESITEIEVWHGALNQAGGQGLFYFRDPGYAESLPVDERSRYLEVPTEEEVRNLGAEEAKRQAEHRRKKLTALKDRIRRSGQQVCDGYRDPVELADRVFADLSALIDRLFPPGAEPTALDREAAEHESFAQSRAGIYIGRQEYFQQLNEFAQAAGGEGLIVLGEPGSGKSALLANWLQLYRKAHPDELILYHALGATPYSSDGPAMLRRLLGEFRRRLGVEIEIPDRPEELTQAFITALYPAARERVVLVLDGLNHLENRDGFSELLWLPQALPPNLRLIASTLPGHELELLRRRQWQMLAVQPLTSSERRELIVEVLRQAGKALGEQRLARLTLADACAHPLFLRALLEELRVFGVHERLDERIAYYLSPPDSDGRQTPTAADLFDRILERYEVDYERERPGLVGDTMRFLWASRRGLQEQELLALLGSGNQEPVPQAYWAPLYLAAEHALMYQAGRIGFFHHFMRQAVETRYLATEEQQLACHRQLAEYLDTCDWVVRVRVQSDGQELPGDLAKFAQWTDARVLNPRRTEELPWQLARAKEWTRLARVLADLSFLKEAWDASRADVEGYWTQLYQHSPWRLMHAYSRVLDDPVQYLNLVDPVLLLLDSLGEYSAAQEIEKRLIDHYRVHQDPESLAGHLHGLATRSRRLGDLDGAMVLHQEEEEICRRLNDLKGLAMCLGGQALVLRRLGQFDRALALHREEEQIARRLEMPMLLVSSLNNQALVLAERGASPAEILRQYREVERLARRLNEPWVLAHTLLSLTPLEFEPLRGRSPLSDEDLRFFLRSVFPLVEEASQIAANCHFQTLAKRLQPVQEGSRKTARELAQRLTTQGVELFRKGATGQALILYREAEDIYAQVGDLEGVSIALGEQGLVLLEQGDSEAALLLMRREEQICRKLNDISGLATCLGNQIMVLMHSGDFDGAIELLNRQEEDCAPFRDPVIQARRLTYQASILDHRGDAPGAIALLSQAEEIFRAASDAEGLAACVLRKAQLLPDGVAHLNDKVHLAEQALALATEHGFAAIEEESRTLLRELKPLEGRHPPAEA
jgi:tetratricopeptide (TPR) repeat protein